MDEELCTIYDCEWDLYYKGLIKDNTILCIDDQGKSVPASEYVCEYIDFDMVQFYTGHYIKTYDEALKDTSKWGYFKLSTGRMIVPPVYEYVYPFYGDRGKVKRKGKYGFVDPSGTEVVETIWDDTADAFHAVLCWARKGDKFGYIDKYGKAVLPAQFEIAKEFRFIGEDPDDHRYAAIIKKDDKYGYIDENGEYIFEPSFDDAREFWEAGYGIEKKLAPVMVYGKWGFIDGRGEFAGAFEFDDIGEEVFLSTSKSANKLNKLFDVEYTNFYTVYKYGKWGLMNSDFDIIMPEDGKRFVVYLDKRIYIGDGKVTSMRKLKINED